MLTRARKFNPLLLVGSMMVVLLLLAAGCASDDSEAISNLQESIDQLAMAQPEGLTAAEVQDIVQKSIDELAMSQPEGLTSAQVQEIVSEAMMSMDIPEEGLTAEQAQAIVGSAIAAIPTPEGLTAQDVQGIIAMAMGDQPEGLTAMQVQEIVDNALMAAEDPDALTAMKVQEIVAMALEESMMMEEEPKGTIVFADLNWDSAQIQSAIGKYIVQHGYGYPVEGSFGSTLPLFQGLLNGDIDITLEIWLPNQDPAWIPALQAGQVLVAGDSLQEQWQSAFVIPTYLAEANPNLRHVDDIRDHLDAFTEKEDDKVVLWTCPSGWGCAGVNASQHAAYGIDDIVTLKPAGGQAALFASLTGAYARQEPWLGYMWAPSLPANTLDLTRLEEPPCAEGQSFGDGCPYGAGPVRIAVHPSMVQRAPEVIEMLGRWGFTDAQIGEAMAYKAETSATFEEVATWFLTTKEAIWTEWVPSDVAERVRAALASG